MEILVLKIMFAVFILLLSTIIIIKLFDFDDFPQGVSNCIVITFIISVLFFIFSGVTYVLIM